MNQYAEEVKTRITTRLMNGEPVANIAEETGISKDTLYTWRRKARGNPEEATLSQAPSPLSSEQRFAMVVETAPLNELEIGAYCREKGIYPEQLARWRQICAQANSDSLPVDRITLREKTDELRILRAELARKDAALAEAAALLVLEKKVQNLWAEKAPKSRSRSARSC